MGEPTLFIGELGLDGNLGAAKGVIGKLRAAKKQKIKRAAIPLANTEEASMITGIETYAFGNLVEVLKFIGGESTATPLKSSQQSTKKRSSTNGINEIIGQEQVKRALVIAVSGGHNIHMYGPPGAGKTALAKAAVGLLPPLENEDSLDVNHLHSLIDSTGRKDLFHAPPFRSPHHTASDVSIIGGGTYSKPGEISLAHKGILMLDELPEFSKRSLESLRQPLEDKCVTISRAEVTTTYPADFLLIATSNPCPCGFFGSDNECRCTASEIVRYNKKLSGPIMDRIDMHVSVSSIKPGKLLRGKNSDNPRYDSLIAAARAKQYGRNPKGQLNGNLSVKQLKASLQINNEAEKLVNAAAEKMKLTNRGYIKVLRLARTIADLDNSDEVKVSHVSEALQYRNRVEV